MTTDKNKTWPTAASMTVAYYVGVVAVSWLVLEGSGPANGGPNEGMVFAAGMVVLSAVLALVSVVRTFRGNKSTQISTCIHLLVLFTVFSWWSSLR